MNPEKRTTLIDRGKELLQNLLEMAIRGRERFQPSTLPRIYFTYEGRRQVVSKKVQTSK